MKVLVAHPSRQHVRWLLEALEGKNVLSSFWTLLPDSRCLPAWGFLAFPAITKAIRRNDIPEVPLERVHVLWGPLLVQRFFAKTGSVWLRDLGEWFAWTLFDWWVSMHLKRVKPDLVIGYEMCCLRTFQQAKRLGATCILDAAACHFRWVDQQILGSKFRAKPLDPCSALRRRKLCEARLADFIVCPSELAKSTYVRHHLSRTKVFVNPLGYAPLVFFPRMNGEIKRYLHPTFVYVGQLANHKGLRVLLDAFDRVAIKHPSVRLRVVGPTLDLKVTPNENIQVLGRLSPSELSKELANCDCLILPSLTDSLGLVVLEALAVGLPVVVSDHVGAMQFVRDGENGWIVPAGNSHALASRLGQCVNDIDSVRGMSDQCSASVSDYTWRHYQQRWSNWLDCFAQRMSMEHP